MRQEKQLLLDEVKGKINRCKSFVITRYQGLAANAANDFRSALEKGGAELEVVKKRVFLKAASEEGIDVGPLQLEGHLAIVFPGGDALETTKLVYEYQKQGETLSIVGGQIDGKVCTGSQVEMLAQLPGKDEMRAQLLGLFEAPMAQTLSVMDSLLCSIAFCLENKANK